MTMSPAEFYVETPPPVIWTGKTCFGCVEMSVDGWTSEKIRMVKGIIYTLYLILIEYETMSHRIL